MKKILEIKGSDFMKGYSTQSGIALNGIFQTAVGFNPFEMEGYLRPSLSATEITAPSTNPAKILTSFVDTTDSNKGKFYAHSNTKLYEYLIDSPYTQVDKTASISVAKSVAGAIIWNEPTYGTPRYIYAEQGGAKIWSNPVPVQGSDGNATPTEILSGTPTSTNNDIRPMCVGADGNLYVGTTDAVAIITNYNGTSGNTQWGFPFAQSPQKYLGCVVRGLVNDGRYLVIITDNNADVTTSRVVGKFNCRVYFWDMVKGQADTIWDIQDSYLIGGAFLDGKVYIFGYNGIYVCNSVTSPRLIWDFRVNSINKRPSNPYQIAVGAQDIYWADGAAIGQNIYSLRGTIFSSPYTTHDSSYAHTAITKSGNNIVAAVDAPKIYIHNTGTTRGNLTAVTAIEQLEQPFSYSYTKIVLKNPLSSGQAVGLTLYDSNNGLISNTVTKSYSADGAIKNLIFRPYQGAVKSFDDIYLSVSPQAGAIIERITVYGEPIDDHQ